MNMTGKTVAITGASRGIGEAAARLFAKEGANVALIARSADRISAIASELGDTAMALPCDVSDFESVAAAAKQIKDRFGGLDVWIGNAGVIDPISPLAESDPGVWGAAIDINLKGVFNGMRVVLPDMIAKGAGTVITVSSGAAHNPVEGWSAYCSSKAGAYMLTRMVDHENRRKGIRALGLSPGTVATQMQREIKASGVNAVSQLDWSDHIPPEWVAKALLWMCSDDANAFLGDDVSLRDDEIRKKVGVA